MTGQPPVPPQAAIQAAAEDPRRYTDATRWAGAFAEQFMLWQEGGVLTRTATEALMGTWFAYAIETGRAAGAAAERERIREHILNRSRQLEPFADKATITELRILADELGATP